MNSLHKHYRKLTALIVVLTLVGSIFLQACTVDYDQLAEGINDFGDSVDVAVNGTKAAQAPEDSFETEGTEKSEEHELVTEPTATPTPTPAPTATPTPTPTPVPERVNMAELTTVEVTDVFTVLSEDFEQEYVNDDNEVLATFSGNQLAVECGEKNNVEAAINLILNGFYQEAEGVYNRAISDANATYLLTGVNENAENVKVTFEYSENGRIFSIIMTYVVTNQSGEVLNTKTEFANFDMLTGQYITVANVVDDTEAFKSEIKQAIIAALSVQEITVKEEDIDDIFIAVQHPGVKSATCEIYAVIDGNLEYRATTDLNLYTEYFNSYGKNVYSLSSEN